ncbi:MAG TPA: ferrous iron transport protein B [Burkholderiaceae bacterium]|nr:ferrous iron transport protein B [Burkholderiaceae bacterium]
MNAAAAPTASFRVALVGVPNCGKTALFNRLTGSRQKVANYPGVTVERKEGAFNGPGGGRHYRLIDLPGTYSLVPATLDEAITRDAITGRLHGEPAPDLIVCVVDATNLRLSLRLVLELERVGRPVIVALNMSDLARKRGYRLNRTRLESELRAPVVETVAVQPGGARELIAAIDARCAALQSERAAAGTPLLEAPASPAAAVDAGAPVVIAPVVVPAQTSAEIEGTQREARRILQAAGYVEPLRARALARLDAVVMNPIAGPLLLAVLLFAVFQAVFAWARLPMDWISNGMAALAAAVAQSMPSGALQSLLTDGIIKGAGSVLVFLPQILILFFFILLLEDSGYLPRAAFLLDRLMGSIGLSGRSFIPLLSSYACAIPGIMATRTIPNLRDRIATILLAPLMTCSARLPVYALIIGAFIPDRSIGWFSLRGLVLFGLYVFGVLGAVLVAFVMKRVTLRAGYHPLMLELPEYHWPNVRNLAVGLYERTVIFMTRVGTIILALMILLWALSSFPGAPPGATGPAIQYSLAGMLGRALHTVFAPLGFNWQICVALVPGLAAREVAVGALGTVYALTGSAEHVDAALRPMLAASWSLPTALSLLAWYVFAPQCLSTLATVRRETNSWRYPLIMAGYLFAMAYVASFLTYQIANAVTMKA